MNRAGVEFGTKDAIIAARQLADFACEAGITDFRPTQRKSCDHLGAVIADSTLQAGLNYRTVVRPRVERIVTEFDTACDLSGLTSTLEQHGAENFLGWQHPTKVRRFEAIVEFFVDADVSDTTKLRRLLASDQFQLEMMTINGVGPKTVDYLGCLIGLDFVAIDRHVFSFSKAAGVPDLDYFCLRKVVTFAADLLEVSRRDFDSWIWNYMTAETSEQLELPLH